MHESSSNNKRSRRIVHAAVATAATTLVLLAWMTWQNHVYESRLERLYDRAAAASTERPEPLDAKQAVVDAHLPGIVASVRISEIIYTRTLIPDQQSMLDEIKALEPPRLWRSHHEQLVAVNAKLLAAHQAQVALLTYADRFLGSTPSRTTIAALHTDAQYRALGKTVDSTYAAARADVRKLNTSTPRLASLLPWSPGERFELTMRGDTRLRDNVQLAASCASAELERRTSPSAKCGWLLRRATGRSRFDDSSAEPPQPVA